jgi:hypothetical protein
MSVHIDGGYICIGGPNDGDTGFCGDGVCDADESCATCPADCRCTDGPRDGSNGFCGDGVCNGDESCTTCPSDCRCPDGPTAFCGDGLCNGAENCLSCPSDCRCPDGPTTFCGDGICNGLETCTSCPTDCRCPDAAAFCGDGICNGLETCVTCPFDCICQDAPVCPATTTIFSTASVDTIGGINHSMGSCDRSNPALGPDVWFRFTAPLSATSCTATTSNLSSGDDTIVYVRSNCGGPDIVCDDDIVSGNLASSVTWTVSPGAQYYIIVDGYGSASGTCTLTVSCI